MARPELPTFDLVVATVGRTEELDALFGSLEAQSHRGFRVLVVDQNEDDRVEVVLPRHPELRIERLRSPRGLSRARNAALAHVEADLVGFPDDDCSYPADLLERVAARLHERPDLGGITGRTGAEGHVARNWSPNPGPVTRDTVWHRANSASMFLRRDLVRTVGPFDESLGLGSGTLWASAEEVDYLLRAIALGMTVEYEPSFVVRHPVRSTAEDVRWSRRDGASVGYLLRKHRLPARIVVRMLVRPVGGAATSLVRGDLTRARLYAGHLRGRIAGYRRARGTLT